MEISPRPIQQTAALPSIVHIMTVPQSLQFLRRQSSFIQAQGVRLHVVTSPGPQLDDFAAQEAVTTYAVPMERRITPLQDIVSIQRIARVLRSIQPHIVHAHTPKGGLLGTIAAWVMRVPVRIYHIRGLPYMSATGRKRTLMMWTERVACFLADEVLCVSHSIRDVAVADRICPPGKIKVLLGGSGNGVDALGRFNPGRFTSMDWKKLRQTLGIEDTAFVIGFVGRIVRDKGIHELAEAWHGLRQTYPEAHLVLTGPLEPQDPINPEVLRTLKSDERVHLLGRVDDTSTLYPALDLVVLPTYREGFPNVPLEAAAMELPVVATQIPGCVDAVQDGVTGTLVPAQNADALRIAIERYLDDPELREQHGKAGRERVLREFRQEAIWEAIYQEYVRLLEDKGLPAPVPGTMG